MSEVINSTLFLKGLGKKKNTNLSFLLLYSWLYGSILDDWLNERQMDNLQNNLNLEENYRATLLCNTCSIKIKIYLLSKVILIACWNKSLTAVLAKLFLYSFFLFLSCKWNQEKHTAMQTPPRASLRIYYFSELSWIYGLSNVDSALRR